MRSIICFVGVMWLVASAPSLEAANGNCATSKHGRHVRCPSCHNDCVLSVSMDETTKHIYDVECETICIPRVVFPWQKRDAVRRCGCGEGCAGGQGCCPTANNGAKTRCVRKLKKYEYQCPKCKYEWNPRACGSSACLAKAAPAKTSPAAPPQHLIGTRPLLPPAPKSAPLPPAPKSAPLPPAPQSAPLPPVAW
jgi:hypothetical protein